MLPVSATKTSPAASTATPSGLAEPGADGLDGAVGQDFLDRVVAGVGDEDVAGRVHRHAGRAVEPGADGLDGAVGQDFLDGVVAGVGDEDVAGRVHRHAVGQLNPEPMVLIVPLARTSLTALLPVSATKTSPAASTATPCGPLNPEPMVLMVPLGRTSLTALLPVSATKTSPAASTATPNGQSNPEPTVVSTVGVNRGLVEYWNGAVVVEPFGLTVALSVAPVSVIELAAPVATVGGAEQHLPLQRFEGEYSAANPPRTASTRPSEAAPDSAGGSVSEDERRRARRDRSGSCLIAGSAGVGRGLRKARLNAQGGNGDDQFRAEVRCGVADACEVAAVGDRFGVLPAQVGGKPGEVGPGVVALLPAGQALGLLPGELSAICNQLPCFGVGQNSIRRTNDRAFSGSNVS